MLKDFETGKSGDWKQVVVTTGRHTFTGWIHKDQDEERVKEKMLEGLESVEEWMDE